MENEETQEVKQFAVFDELGLAEDFAHEILQTVVTLGKERTAPELVKEVGYRWDPESILVGIVLEKVLAKHSIAVRSSANVGDKQPTPVV